MLKQRIESLDLLMGLVMIVMPVTHFCAPVFVFLAGISACLYGSKKGQKALPFFLLTRGIWLVLVDVFIVGLLRTFNLGFSIINLQVIWAMGIGMMVLSVLVRLDRNILLVIGVVLVAGHNLLDPIHLPLLHDTGVYVLGHFTVVVKYPVLPWIGIIVIGYCTGHYYLPEFDPVMRKPMLIMMGFSAISIFIVLRAVDWYGDASHWSSQKNVLFTMLSFLNVTKYPPSLLYTLMTLGPALLFLALSEKPLNKWEERIAVFGRTPLFFYLAHILLIHLLAVIAAVVPGHKVLDMVLSGAVNDQPELKAYGFSLIFVYLAWIGLLLILYPVCKRYDRYKRAHLASIWWLSYL
jgi:uncharacterized membrane protein